MTPAASRFLSGHGCPTPTDGWRAGRPGSRWPSCPRSRSVSSASLRWKRTSRRSTGNQRCGASRASTLPLSSGSNGTGAPSPIPFPSICRGCARILRGAQCALGARASETLGGAGALRPAPAGRARRPAAPRAILSRSRRSPLGRLPVGRGAGPGRPAPGRGGRAAIVRVPRSGTRGPARGRQRGERTAARAGRPARHEVDDRRGTTRRALLRDRVRSRARPGPHRDRDGRALRRVRAQPGSGRLPGRGGAADASAPRRLVRDRSRPSARPRPAPGARLRYDLEPAAVDRLRLQVASTEEGTIAWSIVEIHLYEAAPAPASGRPPPFARGTRRGDTGR